MNKIINLSFLSAVVIGLASCGGGDNDNNTGYVEQINSEIRVLHASQDAPMVNVNLDGAEALSGVDFSQSSELINLQGESHSISVDGILPGGAATVIGPVDLTFMDDMIYEIVAVGSVSNIEPVVVSREKDFDEKMVRVQVLHAFSGAPLVDVHVTAPGDMLSSGTVLGSFDFKETLGPVEIGAGDYRIRVTLPGDLDALYDSGTVSLPVGSDVFIAAIGNTTITDAGVGSPVALSVAVNGGAANSLYSVDDGADLRVVHNSADAPAVDIIVNNNFEAPLVEDLIFPSFTTSYVNVPADTYNVKVVAANTATDVIDADLALVNATNYTVIALNELASIEPLVLLDNARSVATEARVRVIHGSTLAGEVDIYVTAVGADITDIDPAVTGFEFKEDTGYISLAEGSYDVTVTALGSKDAALGPAQIDISNGGIYTILARDEEGLGGVNLTLMDDFSM